MFKHSVLSPLIRALNAFIEGRHWLVCAPDLYLHEIRALVSASMAAVNRDLVHILPSLTTSEYIVDLLLRECAETFLKRPTHQEYIWACFAEESKDRGVRLLNQQQVRTSRTK